MRYFISVEYIGTNYSGFQQQVETLTIQKKINESLGVVLKQNIETTTSSRTDAGVHAYENYLHFDSTEKIDDKKIYNINSILPNDIAIKKLYQVKDNAHCRFDAISRTYKYKVHQYKKPFLFNRSYYFPFKVNIEAMNEACTLLKKYKDFTSFSKKHTQVNNFNCTIEHAQWSLNAEGDLEFTIKANRFLRGMVRAIVSTTLLVGTGKISLTDFEEIIRVKDCTKANFSAPGCGLYLMEVEYDVNKILL